MWFWFHRRTLLSLLGLRKSTASALIIGFSETFWFGPRTRTAIWMWFVLENQASIHTQTCNWSHMIKVSWGLADFNRCTKRSRGGGICLKTLYFFFSSGIDAERGGARRRFWIPLCEKSVCIQYGPIAVWLLSSVISPHTVYYVKVA